MYCTGTDPRPCAYTAPGRSHGANVLDYSCDYYYIWNTGCVDEARSRERDAVSPEVFASLPLRVAYPKEPMAGVATGIPEGRGHCPYERRVDGDRVTEVIPAREWLA